LAAMPRASALTRLHSAGIPAAAARHTTEAAHDPAILAVDLAEKHHFPDGKPYLVPNRYARFSRTEHPPVGDAPGVGEHSRDVLAEAGLSPAEIDALIQEKAVLQGAPLILQALVNYR
jgi:crotonobetainyl-CoA:carnitine CoA-transferase CaiB-like acyl-CoA transferase